MNYLPNYLEYCDLFEEWTYAQLEEAYLALTSSDKQEELFCIDSTLITFLIDTEKQEKLILYFEDKKKDEQKKLEEG